MHVIYGQKNIQIALENNSYPLQLCNVWPVVLCSSQRISFHHVSSWHKGKSRRQNIFRAQTADCFSGGKSFNPSYVKCAVQIFYAHMHPHNWPHKPFTKFRLPVTLQHFLSLCFSFFYLGLIVLFLIRQHKWTLMYQNKQSF